MPAPEKNDPQRTRLAELSTELRDATYAALQTQSLIAAALDEARNEVDRLLMLEELEPLQCRRVERRARMMLDAWLNMTGTGAARSR